MAATTPVIKVEENKTVVQREKKVERVRSKRHCTGGGADMVAAAVAARCNDCPHRKATSRFALDRNNALSSRLLTRAITSCHHRTRRSLWRKFCSRTTPNLSPALPAWRRFVFLSQPVHVHGVCLPNMHTSECWLQIVHTLAVINKNVNL